MSLDFRTPLLSAFLLLFLSGCATLTNTLTEEQMGSMQSIALLDENPAANIDVMSSSNTAAASQFGLIGALIGSAVVSSRKSAAERKAIVMRQLAEGMDHKKVIQSALNKEFSGGNISVMDDPNTSNGLLNYSTTTAFSPDSRTLQIRIESTFGGSFRWR